MAKFKMHILVCGGTGCTASQSQEIADRLKSNLLDKGLENEILDQFYGHWCVMYLYR